MRLNLDSLLNSFKDHSGTICAVAAVAGVFVTAYFSGKAAVEAKEKIKPEMETKEKVKTYAKVYAKTAVAAGVTCGLIIGSDRIHVGKELALAGVATMWKDKYVSLDKKMVEEVGEEKAKEIHKEIVKDEIKQNPYTGRAPIGREILVYEPYTKQYIITTTEKIAWALLSANRELQTKFDVRLNYIIKMIGGDPCPYGNKIGWNMENECQDYCWSYYGGPWISLWPGIETEQKVNGKGAMVLIYEVEPETQEPEDMIYSEES